MTKLVWFVCLILLVLNYQFQKYISNVDVAFGGGVIILGFYAIIINLILLGVALQSYVRYVEENEEKTSIILGTILLIILTAITPILIFPKLLF